MPSFFSFSKAFLACGRSWSLIPNIASKLWSRFEKTTIESPWLLKSSAIFSNSAFFLVFSPTSCKLPTKYFSCSYVAITPSPLTVSTTASMTKGSIFAIVLANGWLLFFSIAAASLIILALSPFKTLTALTSGWPIVNVPVLSKAISSTFRISSITCEPLKIMPFLAPLPIPATVETGTPITNAPGQPRTIIVIANLKLRVITPTIRAMIKINGV